MFFFCFMQHWWPDYTWNTHICKFYSEERIYSIYKIDCDDWKLWAERLPYYSSLLPNSPLNFLERITDFWYNFLNISVPKQGLWKAMRASKLSCRKGKSKDPAFVKKIFSLAAKFHLWRKEILCWRRKRKKKRGSCN